MLRSDLSGCLRSNHKILVYKNSDNDHDGAPDLVWEHSLAYKNFNGVVLADLDDNGTMEVIAPNQGRKIENGNVHDTTYFEVFNALGTYYYPKNTIRVRDPRNQDKKAVTMPVIPTPALTWITVEYTLPECCDNADFELASITGVKVMTATLDGNKGSKTLDLKSLPEGVYLYTVHCGNHNYNGKVVVTK